MDIRLSYTFVFTLLAAALGVCALWANRSHKTIGKSVALLCAALIPPVLGNLVIIGSSERERSILGYYIYFLGMNFVMFALVNFTDKYCRGVGNGSQKRPTIMYVILACDSVQMLLNLVLGHAFDVESITVENQAYYRLVPFIGQTLHRIVDYSVYGAVILIFALASLRTARVYRERYTIILAGMVGVGLWQTFYIFSRTPIDRSMIGYGFFGIIVFYLSLYYRPLRLLDRMLSNIASNMTEALFVFDGTGKCIWANEPGLSLTGSEEKDLEAVPEKLKSIFGDLAHGEPEWTENKIIGSGANERYYTLDKHSVNADSKHIAGSFLSIRDTTEEQLRMKREIYNSTHDSLTGLFTKQYLFGRIRKMLDANKDVLYYAVFADVKNFKIVNDVFSAEFGDLALKKIAAWIRQEMSERCVYGRLAGDTFGMLIPAEEFHAEHLEKALSDFTVTDGSVEHHLLIHLGVYEVVERDTEVSVMFDRAHLSLAEISEEYATHIAYYDNKLREKKLWDQQITAAVHEAIRQMQIRPYLQPITDRSGRVVGAEALARWIHPEYGYMPPYKFIPVFEKNGMIAEVDRHIWECACKKLAEWKGIHDDLFISVNISPKDFYFFDVAAELKALVKQYGLEPAKLRVEITETLMMTEQEGRMKILEELRRSGFIVEMDDFGSGYSSLNMLKDMPVDVLKLDMKFLSRAEDNEKAQIIIRNIIRLAEELSIVSLTEGVETEAHYAHLSEMGCKLFQGYYFAKPMPVEEFEQFVEAQAAK